MVIANQHQNQNMSTQPTHPSAGSRRTVCALLGSALALAACKSKPLPPYQGATTPPTTAPASQSPTQASATAYPALSNMLEYRRRAAQLMIQANASLYHSGQPPEMWPGICTVTVMLNADGSIRALDLLRASRVSPEINQQALDIVRRTGRFGPVGHLPQPWQFNETFLFTDQGRFALDTVLSAR